MQSLFFCSARARRRVLIIAPALTLVAAACGSVTDSIANSDTFTYKSALFSLNGSPIGAPNAINTPNGATVRAEIGYAFDIAFDLDPSGTPVIMTQRTVGSPLGSAGHMVSLQKIPGTFASVTEAPTGGWIADSVLTVAVGDVFGVRANVAACQIDVSPFMYSKIVVDSVLVSERRLWVSVVTDPNCGFRSFAPGRPTN
jgi:hypothetical protein